ncbi:hypothetical protein RIR_jg39421.t1 [Rhizophagus irregularis DAOM 181602=DAOM 197198]|nr:hypothetical protein RIR_jg39421.t1 [Rhizophagus irregularis DAOM 181602=DAOM 197198]
MYVLINEQSEYGIVKLSIFVMTSWSFNKEHTLINGVRIKIRYKKLFPMEEPFIEESVRGEIFIRDPDAIFQELARKQSYINYMILMIFP